MCNPVNRRRKKQPYGCFLYGAGDEARTRYLHLGKVALYRMSYTRMDKAYYSVFFSICQEPFHKNRFAFHKKRFAFSGS